MKTIFFGFILLVITFSSASFGQENAVETQFRFRGVIKDKDSTVFAGIPLFFKKNDKETFVPTDINGEFSIYLSPGNYEITVRKTISETFKAYVLIQENGLNPNDVEFVIETNPFSSGNDYPKIINSPKTKYPPAGRAVRATGEVIVDVEIDKEGKVISASVVSGHPLLKATSLQAARQILFEAAESDAPKKAKITYVFLQPDGEKKNIKRYSNPYRVEIISEVPTVNY